MASGSSVSDHLLVSALEEITAESTAALDWLIRGVDRQQPITFVPNAGNIGDAAINFACHSFLTERFPRVHVCDMASAPATECVFLGGGGNLVEPLYVNVRDFLERLAPGHQLFIFPATIHGYSSSLRRVAAFARILCRERASLAYVRMHVPSEKVSLAHDAAFLLASRLRRDLADAIVRNRTARCRSFRTDVERAHPDPGGLDIMSEYQGAWTDMTLAYDAVLAASRFLLGFGEVETDRLHCAILSAILGRRTVLRANSYFKNAAVFDYSLSRLRNTTFLPNKLPSADRVKSAV